MRAHAPAPPRFLPWLLAAALGVILFAGLASQPILSHNEARRMVVAQEIVRSGHWLLPTMNGELYITKPPLYTWLQAALARLTGSTAPWVLRLPSALSALLLLIWLYRFIARHRDRLAALSAVLVLGTSQLFVLHARNAEIEMLLTLLCAGALFLAWDRLRGAPRSRLWLAWGLLGLAILTKGPVALLFFVPPLLLWGLWREPAALRLLVSPVGWLLCLVVALPWYLYVLGHVDRAVIEAIVQHDIADKVRHRGGAPWYSYLGVIAGGFLPWLLVGLRPPLRARLETLRRDRLAAFLAVAAFTPALILSLFSAKHGKYLLPAFPAFAGWIGLELNRWLKTAQPRARRALVAVAVVMLTGTALFHVWLAPRVWQHRHQALEPIAAEVRRQGSPLYAYRARPIQLIYRLGHPVPVLQASGLDTLRAQGRPFLLLVDSRYWKDPALQGLTVVRSWPVYLKKKRAARLYRFDPGHATARSPEGKKVTR